MLRRLSRRAGTGDRLHEDSQPRSGCHCRSPSLKPVAHLTIYYPLSTIYSLPPPMRESRGNPLVISISERGTALLAKQLAAPVHESTPTPKNPNLITPDKPRYFSIFPDIPRYLPIFADISPIFSDRPQRHKTDATHYSKAT